jgi:large subunit ribosomal protein L25
MSDTITLTAKKRDILGKKLHQLRAAGEAPAVVHDHGKESVHVSVGQADIKKVFSQAGKHHPVVLKVDGKNYTTLIKEIVYKPATQIITHTVFQSVNANETVSAEIPVQLVGEIPAERAGLLVLHGIDRVEVEALPKNLVDVIEIDASVLAEVGDRLHVSDLKIPSGMTIKTDPDQVVASVEQPKDQVAEADAAAAEQAAEDGKTEESGEAESVEGTSETDSDEKSDESAEADSK